MKEVILIKNGELALKGLNRSNFEDTMIRNLRHRLKPLGICDIFKAQSAIFVEPRAEDYPFDKALDTVARVFGIAAFSRAAAVEKDLDVILKTAPLYLADTMKSIRTFKVESKRADKAFPHKSPEISAEVGGALLAAFPHLRVNVHEPDAIVNIEIRDRAAYIHCGQIKGAGGMPVGTSGKATVLISGGIDSPVAAYMMSKRGLVLDAVHFASPPYTSERAEQKVKRLLSKVAAYSGNIRLAIVPFTEIQEQIAEKCAEEYFTLIMRRFMMKIASRIAEEGGSAALITGESLGQVASQTMPALACTEDVATLPVLRPLIGMDKHEIVEISRKIDCFDISIEPYEDCCTVFTPKHPRTKPTVEECRKAESVLPIEELIDRAVKGTVFEHINS